MVYWGYTGTMEKRMETNMVDWGFLGIMEQKMETTTIWSNCLQLLAFKL